MINNILRKPFHEKYHMGYYNSYLLPQALSLKYIRLTVCSIPKPQQVAKLKYKSKPKQGTYQTCQTLLAGHLG